MTEIVKNLHVLFGTKRGRDIEKRKKNEERAESARQSEEYKRLKERFGEREDLNDGFSHNELTVGDMVSILGLYNKINGRTRSVYKPIAIAVKNSMSLPEIGDIPELARLFGAETVEDLNLEDDLYDRQIDIDSFVGDEKYRTIKGVELNHYPGGIRIAYPDKDEDSDERRYFVTLTDNSSGMTNIGNEQQLRVVFSETGLPIR